MPAEPLILTEQDFGNCLAELRPMLSDYRWVLAILRQRFTRKGATGGFPYRVYDMLRRFFNPRKPYFIGQTQEGVKFVGDITDMYSVLCGINPKAESPMGNWVTERLQSSPGMLVDLGANMGLVSACVSVRTGGKLRAVAVEPIPRTVKRTAATFALNGITNVTLVQAAVGDQDGEITFYQSEIDSAACSAHRNDYDVAREITVPCVTLDSLSKRLELQRVSVIKMDVEGNEMAAVRGGMGLIQRDAPTLIYEYNSKMTLDWAPGDMEARLRQLHNYRSSEWEGDNYICQVEARG